MRLRDSRVLGLQASMVAVVAPYLASALVLLVLPMVLPLYLQTIMTTALIMAIFAMSLDILWGYTGLFSLGHAAFLGAGGYTAGLLMVRYGVTNFWAEAALGVLLAGMLGALFGIVALRVAGAYFLLVTLALGQVMQSLATSWSFMSNAGGTEGVFGIGLPTLGILGGPAWTTALFYYMVYAIFVVCFLALARFVRTPIGYSMQGVRESEPRMRALGYNTWAYRFVAFVVGSVFAGVAGILLAYQNGFTIPDNFGIATSTIVLLMVLIGGPGTLYGPVLGAIFFVLVQFLASSHQPQRWPLILGGILVAAVMGVRGGVAKYLSKAYQRLLRGRLHPARPGWLAMEAERLGPTGDSLGNGAPDSNSRRFTDLPEARPSSIRLGQTAGPGAQGASVSSVRPPAEGQVALRTKGLSKDFGGVQALKDISFSIAAGQRVALIGPNGAGKSTLFNIINGQLQPSTGHVFLFENDVTQTSVYRRARIGVGRSFQVANLFPKLSVLTNVWLAVQGMERWRWEGLRPVFANRAAAARVATLLREWGLWELRDGPAELISYGEQRRLEIAMALAARPRLLLMDEPSAGLTVQESQAVIEHVKRLGKDVTLLLVAHDMDLVFGVADRILVLHQGEMIADGTAADVRSDSRVQEIYMGAEAAGDDA